MCVLPGGRTSVSRLGWLSWEDSPGHSYRGKLSAFGLYVHLVAPTFCLPTPRSQESQNSNCQQFKFSQPVFHLSCFTTSLRGHRTQVRVCEKAKGTCSTGNIQTPPLEKWMWDEYPSLLSAEGHFSISHSQTQMQIKVLLQMSPANSTPRV